MMGRTAKAPARRRAFTLVELIASMSVLAIVASVGAGVVWTAAGQYADGAESVRLHSETSVAMDRIVRALRSVDAESATAPAIDTVTASSIAWNTDCSLTLSGTDLLLTEDGGAPGVLLRGVTTLSVTAYDADNAAMGASLTGAACDDIRRISITITASSGAVSETIRTRVYLRCMMLESMT